ncbi:MAG TPA: hypothetical protein VFP12_13410 [Allosphingosinicella sp.]|nr:hypothetical protein [Allosphingosinicella sp.]
MSKDRASETIDRSGASRPAREKRDGGFVREKGEDPSPDDQGETSSADDQSPIDLDTVHDRAS